MTSSEQLLPLTDAERAVLNRKRKRSLIVAPACAALSILLLLVLVGLLLAEFFSMLLLTLLLGSVVLAINALLSTIAFFRLNRDLREGQKRFVDAPVEAQDIVVPSGGGSSSAYTFWIKAGGRKINVSEEQYYQVKKGDSVQAYVAPYSGTVFGLSKTGDMASELSASESAETSQIAPARKPLNKTTKRSLIAAAVIVGVGVLFLGAVAVAVMAMSEKTYNSLNPFDPKPPQGAFPEVIAGYKHDATYYNDHRGFGDGYHFTYYYKSPRGDTLGYHVIDFGSSEKVKEKMAGTYYLSRDAKVVMRSEARVAALHQGGAMVLLAAGPRLIRISGKPVDVIEFENDLPYAAFGLIQPAPRTVADLRETPINLRETPIPVASMLDEFAKNKIAAATKYDGNTFLFSGTIASTPSKGLNDSMLIGIQGIQNSERSNIGSITASFPTSAGDKLAQLKVGQPANFRCAVFAFKDSRNFSILKNCKLE
jgi:hypothetical protein